MIVWSWDDEPNTQGISACRMSCDLFAQIILSLSSEHRSRERGTEKLEAHNALRMNCDEANSRSWILDTSSWQIHSHSNEIYLNEFPNVGPKFMFLAPTIVNFELGRLSLILGSGYQPIARMKISKLGCSLVVSPLGMFFNTSVQVMDVRTGGRTY